MTLLVLARWLMARPRLVLAGVLVLVVASVVALAVARYHSNLAAARALGRLEQQAQDQRTADALMFEQQKKHQALLDSIERADSVRFTAASRGFSQVITKYKTDTSYVVREIVKEAEAAVNSCSEGWQACRIAREQLQRDLSSLRDSTMHRDTVRIVTTIAASPRSCTVPTAIGVVSGGLLGAFLKR